MTQERPPTSTRPRSRVLTCIAVLVVGVVVATACDPSPLGPDPVASPTAHSVPAFRHVFVVVFENESRDAVFGSGAADAPYLNSLARSWSFLDRSYGVAHNSLPNYIAMTSGQPPTSTTRADCPVYNCVYPDRIPNIADEIQGSGRTWKVYLDGTDEPCVHGVENRPDPYAAYVPGANSYAQRHNPFVYYGDVVHRPARCRRHLLPYAALTADLAADHLPDYGLLVPDLCHDGHDRSCGIAAADTWASRQIPRLLASPDFRDGGVLFVTFDESAPSDTAGCCGDSDGGRIGTIVVSPTWGRPAGYRSRSPVNHYSLLRTIEDAWGLDLLGRSQDPGIHPMTDLFTATPH